jgi:hypothetical protein
VLRLHDRTIQQSEHGFLVLSEEDLPRLGHVAGECQLVIVNVLAQRLQTGHDNRPGSESETLDNRSGTSMGNDHP